MNTIQFGEHLTIDGYGGSYALLNDQARVFEVISKLPDLLGMHALSQPLLVSAPDNEIKDPGGWSGFVIIAESHIALHTFPKRGFVSADVYTCQAGLDVDFICNFFTQQFDLQDIETHFIPRGTRYPVDNIHP